MARMKFYLMSLGNNDFILGYPFLYVFNPGVDWRVAKLLGGSVQFESIPFRQAERHVKACQQAAWRIMGKLPLGEEVWVRRSTVA